MANTGYSLIAVHGPLTSVASLVVEYSLLSVQAQFLWPTGLVAWWHVESSRTGDQTGVPCIARQILNHWTTSEAQYSIFN